MADGLDIVAVRIADKCTEVIGMVLGPQTWLVQDLGPTRHGSLEEGPYGGAISGGKGNVRLPKAIAGRLRA